MNGRKRHILVDTLGLLLAVVVTSAALSDPAGARLLLRRLGGACKKLRRIWVDVTYRGHLLEWVILHYRFRLQPVLRSDEQKGFVVLPRRWVVERTFWYCKHTATIRSVLALVRRHLWGQGTFPTAPTDPGVVLVPRSTLERWSLALC